MNLLRKLFSREREEAAPFCSAVIVAAGQASRMEGIDKILCPLGESPCCSMPWSPSRPRSWWMRL